ncbi:AAEL005096-PA [Aedes aegypti]|uniref:AAEL005096-PA n=1 Tax=Aedes aegypti TaxID=7159 RepID=Q17B37_AEDAE|nr:AAEL005096-PA [Aedes aegypti]
MPVLSAFISGSISIISMIGPHLKHSICLILSSLSVSTSRIPQIPPTTHRRHLDQNKLKSLPDIFFPPNTWLHILILSGNQITKLTAGNFANLDFLEELYLNNNKLTKLDLGMIPILASLRTLSLARNQIRTISVGALNLPKLEHLYLSENRLRMVANDTFSKLPNLLGLFLNDNEISHFQLGSFAGINNLTTISLVTHLNDCFPRVFVVDVEHQDK